ncbi:hypothetical protein LWM68_43710 [Niabella sp. W65]|nr:hypothetical protein [Niabella sp. W65]MCH7369034.1 hypothetical protein [Niabella sp. W65]
MIACSAWTQTTLSNSPTRGTLTQVYRLTDKETEMLIQNPQAVNDAFFHELADSYTDIRQSKKLPFGNYLKVHAVKNKLEYQLIAQNNVTLRFVNNRKDFQFTLTDHLGNQVTRAKVINAKGRKIKYNEQSGLYQKVFIPGRMAMLKWSTMISAIILLMMWRIMTGIIMTGSLEGK